MATKNAVVTGANQGIGLEIVRLIAQRPGTRTVLAARNEERGRAALAKLQAELPPGAAERVEFAQLDITSPESIQSFRQWAAQELRHVDVLINNAGFAYKGDTWGAEEAQVTINTNYAGTAAVCEALHDLVPDGGRIVNVCSSAGKLGIIKDGALRARWERATSRAELDELTREFVEGVRADKYAQQGWPRSMYGVSKLAECQYSRILAEQLRPRRIAVAAVCPGWCNTAMASFRGPRPASEGADTPVWLAFLPDSEWERITGRFWKDRREEPW